MRPTLQTHDATNTALVMPDPNLVSVIWTYRNAGG